ncbi:MAG TPA: hypothetical protein DEH25_18620 [Chloroflexi bacterium]|nr:hypothetical protein [Chloroflexota bacterium]
MNLGLLDLVGTLLGFVFTIAVFSYIWGDNAVFRLVIHLFIGVAAGYVAIMVIQNVVLPQMIFPFIEGDRNAKIFAILFLILGTLMLTKISPRLTKLGNPAMAFLVGVGAAAAVGGAVVGTVFPQASASMSIFADQSNPLNAIIILIGTLSTLLYFHFGIRRKGSDDQISQRPAWLESVSTVGQFFIAVTFAALFSGVYLAAITALIERMSFIWNLIKDLIFS